MQLDYVPFDIALSHSFSSLRPRELKRTPDSLWGILGQLQKFRVQLRWLTVRRSVVDESSSLALPSFVALLSAQKSSEGQDADISVDQLQSAASHLLPKLSVKPELLTADTISWVGGDMCWLVIRYTDDPPHPDHCFRSSQVG